ncbi:type II secretion system F family protein [Streptomyces sp. NPDC058001]|uniref:type II secretion system F family protein n=1 Tax=Streptomyces sp. NPDC058001 TaxID=3346300 RepID=UPI0036E2D1B3
MGGEVVHRLGAALCVSGALVALVRVVMVGRREGRVRRRAMRVLDGRRVADRAGVGLARAAARRHRRTAAVRRWLPVVGVVCAGFVLVGGVAGVLVGVAAGYGAWRYRRRPAQVEDVDAAVVGRELPLAADLLAACIAAGADPVTAAQAVGESLDGPVGARLAWGAAEVRLGAEPVDAWRKLATLPGAGAGGAAVARLLERAGESGAPAAAPVARLAAEARAEWGRAATARARRAGVLITAPVGLCFLPAFIAIGVLPVLIGLAGRLMGGGGE